MTQPTSQKWKTHQRKTWLHNSHGPLRPDKKSPGVLFFPGVAPFSINGSLPWLGADGETLFFLCVEPFIPASARRRDTCCFFFQGVSQARSLWMFFVESLRYWRNYTPLYLFLDWDHFFGGKNDGFLFFKSATNLLVVPRIKTYEYGLRQCVSKFFYLHRFF